MYTTTENNDRVMTYRMMQVSCIGFIVLMACHTVPGAFSNLYHAFLAGQAGQSFWGYVVTAVMYFMFTLPTFWVVKIYFGIGKHIEVVRYGNPPANAPDGCLGASIGEVIDGRDTL